MTETLDRQLLDDLVAIPAVSGHEDRMIAFLRQRLQPYGDVHVDGIGNTSVALGRRDGRRLMLFAHMDQLGLCVRRLGDDGFLRVDRIGGVNRKALVARPVVVHAADGRDHQASIGVMAHHLTPDAERFVVPDVAALYVDVGASSRADLEAMGIAVGDPITFAPATTTLGEHRYRAGALDNRVGVFILLETLRSLTDHALPCQLHAVFTVQEEFNVRGSEPAARRIDPAAAVCLDIAVPGDTPDLIGQNDVRLGAGPTVRRMSFHGRGTLGGLIPNPALLRHVEASARAADVPLQLEASIGGLTDASFLQLLHEGIPAIDVGVPARYTHTPIEMIDLRDVAQAVALVRAMVLRFDDGVDLRRGLP